MLGPGMPQLRSHPQEMPVQPVGVYTDEKTAPAHGVRLLTEGEDGWGLNKEQAGPGTCTFYSLDKQICGGFQRGSGDGAGSGVIT